MCAVSALFSDVFYVDTEAVFVLAIYLSIANRAYEKCGLPSYDYYSLIAQYWRKIERRMQRRFHRSGWELLETTSLRRVCIVAAAILLFITFGIGGLEAHRLCQSRLQNNKIIYGLRKIIIGGEKHVDIYSMGKDAFVPFIVDKPILRMRYRAAHSRLLPKELSLTIHVNGVPALTLPLNALKLNSVWWDVTALQGQYVEFSYSVENAFVPLYEKWFVDLHDYGAIVSKPMGLNHSPTNYAHLNGGDWHVQYSENPEWYLHEEKVRKVYK